MNDKLLILNLEDNPNDTELIQAKIEEEGLACEITRVETEKDFIAAVERGGFDIILADYKLPSFDGLSALGIAKEKCPNIPFILISGAIGEELAIESMKRGADDYILKDRISRLASTVRRVLKEAEERVERKKAEHLLEEERLKTQKLESIGRLAGGIAHDFNNLLQSIFGFISMAKLRISNPKEALSLLGQAETALDMSVNLTKQLLTFSKGGKPVKKPISLIPMIENVAKFALSGSRSGFQFDIEPDVWQVDADEGQLGQVIQNIVLNADQAMPEGGTIVITAKNVLNPEKEHPQLPKGNYVEISVKDSGIGIPENYLQKIFDPYFTTKEKGSGLGLAISYSIIRNHGGLINVTSEPGKGTTFFIYLPATEAEIEIKETPVVAPVVGKGKILVMDDEELVLNLAELQIKTLGYEVDLAKTGEAVIEKYQTAIDSGKPFDIVILDLTIRGGMGGKETLERLRAIHPSVRAIVSSGYSSDDVVANYEKYGFKARLNKPYTLENLRDTLNALLSA